MENGYVFIKYIFGIAEGRIVNFMISENSYSLRSDVVAPPLPSEKFSGMEKKVSVYLQKK